MLARRIVGLLPELTRDEALQLAAIRSVAGRLPDDGPMSTVAPFVAPHHSTSVAALVGGGSGTARPGAVSLAHRGVLFLDECPEYGPHLLESLRTPLEEGEVRLARADGTVCYPARFQLILAANPCPCAPAHDRDCVCASLARRRYLGRLSGPLLDRVDLRAEMLPVTALAPAGEGAESTATVRARVLAAREAAAARWAGHGWRTNAEVPGPALRRLFALPRSVTRPLDAGLRAGELTARGADRALRVAWTLGDLAGLDRPLRETVESALYFRDRRREPRRPASTRGAAGPGLSVPGGRTPDRGAGPVRRGGRSGGGGRAGAPRRGPAGGRTRDGGAARRRPVRARPRGRGGTGWPAAGPGERGVAALVLRRVRTDRHPGPGTAGGAVGEWARPAGGAVRAVRCGGGGPGGQRLRRARRGGVGRRAGRPRVHGRLGCRDRHRRRRPPGALTVEGPTVAVLACGIDRAYPVSHTGLLRRIAEIGLVLSEYPPAAVPARHRFLVRNRLLAGLAGGSVVVEAGVRSGAQRTAADARALGRTVMAVPGPVTSGLSTGCHELIRAGALLVTRAEEVLEVVGRLGIDLATELPRPQRATDGLDPVQALVHDALPARAARDIRWLALEASVPAEAVRPALVELERRGLAEYRAGRWQRVVRSREREPGA